MKHEVTNSAACADFLGLKLVGRNIPLFKVSGLDVQDGGAIKFASTYSEVILERLNNDPKSFVIAKNEFEGKLFAPHVISLNPRLDFCKLSSEFFPLSIPPKLEASSKISLTAKLGENVYIGHNVVIEDNVKIGDDTVVMHNVVISAGVRIGRRCLIKSGSVIGQKGFGFERDSDGIPQAFNHYASVLIGDNVEIGALNTVVAGGLTDTIISDFVKTDDHVHIAHNVTVGRSTLITACAEISGSVNIGENSWLGPNVSIVDKCSIGDNAFLGIGAVVTKSIPDGVTCIGNPAKPIDEYSKISRFIKTEMGKRNP